MCAHRRHVHLLGAVREVLFALKTEPCWEGVTVAVASRADEPDWVRECMAKFEVGPAGSGLSVADCIDDVHIYKANKQRHLKAIASNVGAALDELLFFDKERGNCLDAAEIGVSAAWVPDGVSAGALEQSLERFPEAGAIFDFHMGG